MAAAVQACSNGSSPNRPEPRIPDNRAPQFAAVTDRTLDEGAQATIDVSATDPDGDTLTLAAPVLPDFVVLAEIANGTWQLTAAPGFEDSGEYTVDLSVSDDNAASDDLSFLLTVENTNRPPSLPTPGDAVVGEGQSQSIELSATDPDGDTLSYSAAALPAFVTLTDHGDGTATLDLQPGYFAAGVYALNLAVTDPGALADEATFVITVTDVNRAPLLNPIADVSVAEGEILSIPFGAVDPDGSGITLSLIGAPAFINAIDAGDGTGSLILTTGFLDSGVYSATVRATDDGGLTDEKSFFVSVANVNRPPVLSVSDILELAEDETLVVPITATDPDGDAIELTATLPAFASLSDYGDGTGVLELRPDFLDAGAYALTLTASDEPGETAQSVIALTVTDVNRDPVFTAIPDQMLPEGETLTLQLSASDPDSDAIEISGTNLPAFAGLLDNGDGTGTVDLQPDFQDSGTYTVTLQASDTSSAIDEVSFVVTVEEVNRPPVLSDIGNPVVAEGTAQVFAFDASDPDNDTITFEADALPGFITIEDYGSGAAGLRVEPQVLDAGVYSFVVRAVDSGAPNLSDERTVQVTVNLNGANHVARENSLPGTADWHLDNPALLREIEGYASATSVNRGEIISLLVNTAAPSFTLEVFRTGWYGGLGARRVLGPIAVPGTAQITPSPDPITGLVEANWVNPYQVQTSDSLAGDPWPTGVYLARLTESSAGKQSYIIFVVREDGYAHDVLLQLPVTTYQAYNPWGGKSIYDFNSGLAEPWGSTSGTRASHVSFDRPYARNPHDPAGYGMGAGEYLTNVQPVGRVDGAGWDYNMVRWLEHEQYDVGYITNIDTHRSPQSLLETEVLVSQGHDEYWTWEMRDNFEAARDAGIDLAFFASNTAYRQVRFEPNTATSAPDRVMVAYRDAMLDPYYNDLNPFNDYLTTIEFRYLPIPRPEETLIGVQYVLDPYDGDIIVTNPGHWVFDKTGLVNRSRLTGLLGYEPDGMFGGGPANIEVLAETPIESSVDPSIRGTSHMTIYSTPQASVFATGSLQWSWGLDDYNSPLLRTSRLSAAAQQITANVLERFGALPHVGDGVVQASCLRVVSLTDAEADGTMAAAEIDVLDADGFALPKDTWSVFFVDSEGPSPPIGSAENVLDDNLSTYWQTQPTIAAHPHEIQIYLGSELEIGALRYVPRQHASMQGVVIDYEVYASPDCASWTRVADGTWEADLGRKIARFEAQP